MSILKNDQNWSTHISYNSLCIQTTHTILFDSDDSWPICISSIKLIMLPKMKYTSNISSCRSTSSTYIRIHHIRLSLVILRAFSMCPKMPILSQGDSSPRGLSVVLSCSPHFLHRALVVKSPILCRCFLKWPYSVIRLPLSFLLYWLNSIKFWCNFCRKGKKCKFTYSQFWNVLPPLPILFLNLSINGSLFLEILRMILVLWTSLSVDQRFRSHWSQHVLASNKV